MPKFTKQDRPERGYFWIGFGAGAGTVLLFWGAHLVALAAAVMEACK